MNTRFAFLLPAILFASVTVFAQPTITSFAPAAARSFTSVTITGTNFTGATAVSFGGTPANFFFVLNPTQISAVVGSGASGEVVVTTPSGTAKLAGFTFLPPPTILSFSPATGSYGTTVTVKGTDFSNANGVSFGGVSALSFSVLSDTSLTAVVSNGASGAVAVSTPNGQGLKNGFVYTGPVIASFTPKTGGAGTIVNITGQNFTGATAVKFGAIAASSFQVNSATSISATVAGFDSSGIISVVSPQGTASAAGFAVPFIQSISPFQGTKGTVITIKGWNFTGTNTVAFGGTPANSFSVVSDEELSAVLGYGSSGFTTVSNSFGTGTGRVLFYTYPFPTIASFSPTSAGPGAEITIKGTGFTSTMGVQIGSAQATSFTIASDTVLKAIVANTTSGSISINTRGGYASLPGFVYAGPVINSYSPTTAVAGTTVIVTGENLGSTTAVSFGGTPAISFTASPTTVTAVVGNGSSGDIVLTSPLGNVSAGGFKMVPVITSFTPQAGPMGTTVTITGSNFDTTLAGNIVFFGAVKATTLSASPSQVTVKVPAGATYEPLSVTTNNLTAYSIKPFTVTGGGGVLTPSSFSTKMTYEVLYANSPYYGVNGSAVSDIDGDGKPDLLILRNQTWNDNHAFSIFRNNSKDSVLNMEAAVHFGSSVQNASDIAVKDMNGDGKPDIVITHITGNGAVSVFTNNSTPGQLSFLPRLDFSVGNSVGNVAIGDLDGDGRPDMAVAHGNASSSVSVFKNTTSNGAVSFAPKVDYITGSLPYGVAMGDLNGDSKLELVVATIVDATANVFKNTSTIGAISFAPKTDYSIGSGTYTLAITDIDSDGNSDLLASNSNDNTVSVLRNIGVSGSIAFAPKLDLITGSAPYGFSAADVDGDGKPDLVVANNNQNKVSIFKNKSTAGTPAFAPPITYATGDQPRNVSIADLNGDGRPDLVTPNWVSYNASVLINLVGVPTEVMLCPPSAFTVLSSPVTGNSYQWQVDDGNGFADVVASDNYIGPQTAYLQLKNAPSSWTGYRYRCLVDGKENDVFRITFGNRWTGGNSTAWETAANWSCGKLPDANTDVTINSGTVVLSSNATVRSITIKPGANLVVTNGYQLTVTK